MNQATLNLMLGLIDVLRAKSLDRSRQTGFIIARGDQIISQGYNDFPKGVDQTVDSRWERPDKYLFTEHAERNAIYAAARAGNQTYGASGYMRWFPCVDCARAIVQAGISELICEEPDWTEERYNFKEAFTILTEGGVRVIFHKDGNL